MRLIEAAPVVHDRMKVGSAVDVLFSHNETVALWHEQGEERGVKYLLWRGMAWDIPKRYKTMPIIRFFGTIPQNFSESDTINILIELPECGAKMVEDVESLYPKIQLNICDADSSKRYKAVIEARILNINRRIK